MEYDDVMVSACAKKHCHSHDPKGCGKDINGFE